MDFSFSFKKPPKGFSQPPQTNPFAAAEEQFNAVRGCGITPHAKVTFTQLTEGQDPAAFDAAPHAHMLAVMGSTNAEGEPFSDDVWLLNPQGITAEGDYTAIVANIARIAKGAIPIEEVSDALDPDNNAAAIRFTLDGEAVEWPVAIDGNAVAPEALSGLASIAADRGDGARLAWSDYADQKLIVFLNESDLTELASTTGMEWAFIE